MTIVDLFALEELLVELKRYVVVVMEHAQQHVLVVVEAVEVLVLHAQVVQEHVQEDVLHVLAALVHATAPVMLDLECQ